MKEPEQRTTLQNASLHVYAKLLAEKLAEAGLDMRKVIKVDITPTPENVKETMIKPVMTSLFPDKKSTRELSTKEIQQVYEVMNRATAERLGISIEWPSIENRGRVA